MTTRFLARWSKQRHYAVATGILVAASLIASTKVVGQTRQYVVTELSNEAAAGVPCKLNNFGDIVGRTSSNGKGAPRATLWNHSGAKVKHLGVLAQGDYSSATGINDSGEIAGSSNSAAAILPFIWTARGGLRPLPLLPSDTCGQAVAVNKYGHVAGYSSGPSGSRAVLWIPKIGLQNLGVLPGGTYGRALDLNDSDEIVGFSASPTGDRAVVWTKSGNVRDLGTLPGDFASEALAINNAGDVVGYSEGPDGMRAFLWTKGGGMEELGVLPGGDSSRAIDINDLGEIVGTSTSSSGEHAFIWTKEMGIADLNSPASAAMGVIFIEAHAINRKSQILVMGMSNCGAMMNGATAPPCQICTPAPPSTFLLTPTTGR
jgi:probable HAF family extracellular repeat protein